MIESNDWKRCRTGSWTGSAPRGVRASMLAAVLVFTSHAARTEEARGPLAARVTGLRSAMGRVGCTLYDGPTGFPVEPRAALQQRWCPIDPSTGSSTCRFDPIPRGTYAVACFHDENGNGALDRGLFGIPKEGTVVSNHAKGTFGPPKFDDAKFSFAGKPGELLLRISY